MRKKSEISVKDATFQIWSESPSIIHMVIFYLNVRRLTTRPALPDGTISRRLRELRADGKVNYKVINPELSIYQKIPVCK